VLGDASRGRLTEGMLNEQRAVAFATARGND